MTNNQSAPTLAQQDAIIAWLLENVGRTLSDCAVRLGVSAAALEVLVLHDGEFQQGLIRRWNAQRTDTCANPPCPACGAGSARIGYGYPVLPARMKLQHLLPILAREATWSRGCVAGKRGAWECNRCRHHLGSVREEGTDSSSADVLGETEGSNDFKRSADADTPPPETGRQTGAARLRQVLASFVMVGPLIALWIGLATFGGRNSGKETYEDCVFQQQNWMLAEFQAEKPALVGRYNARIEADTKYLRGLAEWACNDIGRAFPEAYDLSTFPPE